MASKAVHILCSLLAIVAIAMIEVRYGFGANRLLRAFDADKSEYTAPMRGRKPRSRAAVYQSSLAPFMDSSFSSDAGLACTPLDDINFAVRSDPYNFEQFYQRKNTTKDIRVAMRRAAKQYFREMTRFGMIDVKGGKDVFLDANSSEFEHKAGQRGARNCVRNTHDFPFLDHAKVQSYVAADDAKKGSCYRRTDAMGGGIDTNWTTGCTANDFKKRSSHWFPNDGVNDGRCSNVTRFLDDLSFEEFREYRKLYKQLLANAGNVTELMEKDARTKCNLQTDDLWHDSCMEADFSIMVGHEYNGVTQNPLGKLSFMGMKISERIDPNNYATGSSFTMLTNNAAAGHAAEVFSNTMDGTIANNDYTLFIGRESCYDGITAKTGSTNTATKDKVKDYFYTGNANNNGVGKKCTQFPNYDNEVDSGDLTQLACHIHRRDYIDPFIEVSRKRWAGCFSPKGITEHNLFWNFITNVAYLTKTQSNAAMCRRNLLVQAITRGHAEVYEKIKATDSTFDLHAFYDATSGPPLKRSDVGIFAAGSSSNKNQGTDETIMKGLYISFGVFLVLAGIVALKHGFVTAAKTTTSSSRAMSGVSIGIVVLTFVLAAFIFGFERRVYFRALETQRSPIDVLGVCFDNRTAHDTEHFMDLYEGQSVFSLIVTPLLGIAASMLAYYALDANSMGRYNLGMLSNVLFFSMFIMVIVAAYQSNELSKGKQVLRSETIGHCNKDHLDNLDEGHTIAMIFAGIGAAVAFVLLVLGAFYKSSWEKITGLGEHIVWIAMFSISVISSIFLYRFNRGLSEVSLIAPISMEDRLKDDIGYAQGTLASILITAFPIVGILWVCVGIVAAVVSESISTVGNVLASMGRFM